MVLNHATGVVTEKWFNVQAGNMIIFVEPDIDFDIGSWFRYRHQCIGAFDSDNHFTYVLTSAESLMGY